MRKLLPLLLLASFACRRSEDQAAKERIFSPEEPVGVMATAKEPIDARRIAEVKLAPEPARQECPAAPACSCLR